MQKEKRAKAVKELSQRSGNAQIINKNKQELHNLGY